MELAFDLDLDLDLTREKVVGREVVGGWRVEVGRCKKGVGFTLVFFKRYKTGINFLYFIPI